MSGNTPYLLENVTSFEVPFHVEVDKINNENIFYTIYITLNDKSNLK